MNDSRLLDYVGHMLEAAELAISYIAEISKDEFLADKRTQQAVILNIVVIGEAATKLDNDYPDFTHRYPDIPWKSMRGMRNRVAHGYFDIDLNIVWDTVQGALPKLVDMLTAIRTGLAGGNEGATSP